METLLQFFVPAGDPTKKSTHRARQMPLPAGLLTFAEHGSVNLTQRDPDDHQASPDAVTLRHLFPCGKQESPRWTSLLQSSIPDRSASPLLVTDGAEQTFGDTLQTIIAMPSSGSEIVPKYRQTQPNTANLDLLTTLGSIFCSNESGHV